MNSEYKFINHNNTIQSSNINSNNNLINSANEIRDIKTVTDLENKQIEGGKILRTRDIVNNQSYRYNLTTNSMRSWLSSNQKVDWIIQDNQTNTINWNHEYNHREANNYAIEWRLLQSKFDLTDEEYKSIINKEKDIVLGIETVDGFEMILPYQDMINILVNGRVTGMSYSNLAGKQQIRINNNKVDYQKSIYDSHNPTNDEYCKDNHMNLSSHTLKNHAHLNSRDSKFDLVRGDISSYVQKGVNNIDILVGQKYDRKNSFDGGISKLDVFLLEKADVDIDVVFYKIDEKTNDKIYMNDSDIVRVNENIFYEIHIKNNSDTISISYPSMTINIKSNIKDRQIINISSDKITLTENDETKNINSYDIEILDGKESIYNNVSVLRQQLLAHGTIKISSKEFVYKVKEEDVINNKISSLTNCIYRYGDDNLSGYKKDKYNQILVGNQIPTHGSIEVDIYNANGGIYLDDGIYLQIKDLKDEAMYNLRIDEVDSYKIDELDLDNKYEIKLILPSEYNVKNSSDYMINKSLIVELNEELINKIIKIELEETYSDYFKDSHKLNLTIKQGNM